MKEKYGKVHATVHAAYHWLEQNPTCNMKWENPEYRNIRRCAHMTIFMEPSI
jgi:hypothetical protein